MPTFRTLTRQWLEDMPQPVPVSLDNGMMGLITSWDDDFVNIDAYRGNDLTEMRIPFSDCAGIGNCNVLAKVPKPVAPPFEMPYGDFDEYETHLIGVGRREVAEQRYTKRAGREIK